MSLNLTTEVACNVNVIFKEDATREKHSLNLILSMSGSENEGSMIIENKHSL